MGQRVAVYPIAACGECFFCKQRRFSLCIDQYGLGHGADGGFAEYVLAPERILNLGGVMPIEDMPFDLAAMIEPTGCCLAAAGQCGTKDGDTVLVIGCGPLGLLHVIVSKALGAKVIAMDMNQDRLDTAAGVGAHETINPEKISVFDEVARLTNHGADIVIAAIGATDVVAKYLPLVRNGGVFNIFGGTPQGQTIELDPRWLHYGEIVLTGTFASSVDDFKQAFMFVQEHRDAISRVISVRCSLEDIISAVERVKNQTALKSVIIFD